MGKRTPIGAFIHTSWGNLNVRCGKYTHLNTKEKCKTYQNILIEFTREEYKNFCLQNKDIVLNLQRPSIDRLDKTKNYSLNNIQFIELSENIRKDSTVFTDTTGICFICKSEKTIEEFSKDKRRFNGRTSICKKCDNLRKKLN